MSKNPNITLPGWPGLLSLTSGAPLYFDLSEQRVLDLVNSGVIPTVRIGRRRYITKADADAFIEALRTGALDGATLAITTAERRALKEAL